MFNAGDRVRATETITEIRKPFSRPKAYPRELCGAIVERLLAEEVYPDEPIYQSKHKGERLALKFPLGSFCYRVLMDGEKHPRMFHESQLNAE